MTRFMIRFVENRRCRFRVFLRASQRRSLGMTDFLISKRCLYFWLIAQTLWMSVGLQAANRLETQALKTPAVEFDQTKLLAVQSLLKRFELEIKNPEQAATDKHVCLGPPQKTKMRGKIVGVRTKPSTYGTSLLEFESTWNRACPATSDEWELPAFQGLVWTHAESGKTGILMGKPVIRGQKQQPALPSSTSGTDLPNSGTYKVTAVTLGQECANGPWYLLDSYVGVIDVD